MIPRPGNLKAVRGLEAEVARLTGDASLARRVRQATAAGRPIDTTLAKAIERAMVKRGAKSLEARNLLNWIAATQNQTLMQVTDPATLAQPLIKSGVVGWAKIPGKSRGGILVIGGNGCTVIHNGKPVENPTMTFNFPYPTTVDRLAFLAHARRDKYGEGEVPHMYQDSTGKVTIGIGHLIESEGKAADLADTYTFVNKFTKQPLGANKRVIAVQEFRKIANLSMPNTLARGFEQHTSIELPAASREQLFFDDVDIAVRAVRSSLFTDYATYPPTAKLAILDMAFTPGVPRLAARFPKFVAAVRNRDWEEAALESQRPQLSTERNGQIRTWLYDAKRREPFFLGAPSRPPCRRDLATLLPANR